MGDGHILVNGENGDLEVGDMITTSSTKGVGMKATQYGTTIGRVQERYHFHSRSETKLIPVQYGLETFVPDQSAKITELQKMIENLQKQIDELKKNNWQGFTLTELLVVISILTILGLLALININPSLSFSSGYDTVRKADLAKIKSLSKVITPTMVAIQKSQSSPNVVLTFFPHT